MEIANLMLPVLLAVFWLAGWILLGRIKTCRPVATRDTLPARKISVIIPARNEEQNLPRLLNSLREQAVLAMEIIVVNDASTDRTVAVAQALGAAVINTPALPDGWRGKTWACHHGAAQAKGDWLLFLDADTWFENGGLPAVLMEFARGDGGALSVAPFHQVRALHEQFSVFFNLIMLAGTGGFTLLGDRLSPRGLLGQFLLIEAVAYHRGGGHSAVKGRILENFWLAEKLRAIGVPLRCRSGLGVFSFRMYPEGWREMMAGWIKGFATGAGQTPLPLLLLVIVWLSGLVMATSGLGSGTHVAWKLAVYGFYAVQVAWLMRRVGSFHWAAALFFPAPLWFYFLIFARSLGRALRKQSVVWKGREIRAD